MAPRRLGHDAYRVGWICPLEEEQIAAIVMLDEEHDALPQESSDTNIYNLGSINNHNVVIAGLPKMGNCSAATVVAQMKITFPKLKYGLLVGIGGGVPVETRQGMIRLGHVVVSQPTGEHSGAVQYDHGKAKEGRFERNGFLNSPPTTLENAARQVSMQRQRMNHDPIWQNVQRIDTSRRNFRHFKFPGAENDRLYPPNYPHQGAGVSCEKGGCDPEKRIKRPRDDEEPSIVVHRGTIASGELVIKDAKKRDNLARRHKVLCFEMEAAGALTDFPCMVIRGISDYCDSHKNDVWHGYAAAVAAAYARQLFFHMPIEHSKRYQQALDNNEEIAKHLQERKSGSSSPRQLADTAKSVIISADDFLALHEGDADNPGQGLPLMQYWYREQVAESGYPDSVTVSSKFEVLTVRPPGKTILSLRSIPNLQLRGQAFDIPPGHYRVRWMVWLWAGKGYPVEGARDVPIANFTENSVVERIFPCRNPKDTLPGPDKLFWFPWGLRFSVGRAKNPGYKFKYGRVDVERHPIIAPELLHPGFQEFKLTPGLWNTFRNGGWCEFGDEIVEVDIDGHLAFVIACWEVANGKAGKFVKTFGGFSFAGVRLEPVC